MNVESTVRPTHHLPGESERTECCYCAAIPQCEDLVNYMTWLKTIEHRTVLVYSATLCDFCFRFSFTVGYNFALPERVNFCLEMKLYG